MSYNQRQQSAFCFCMPYLNLTIINIWQACKLFVDNQRWFILQSFQPLKRQVDLGKVSLLWNNSEMHSSLKKVKFILNFLFFSRNNSSLFMTSFFYFATHLHRMKICSQLFAGDVFVCVFMSLKIKIVGPLVMTPFTHSVDFSTSQILLHDVID